MKEIITFLKEIFMIKEDEKIKVGLSQFKATSIIEKKEKTKDTKPKSTSQVKISDLMRGA